MPGKTRPYEQFGPFILFKKLESDALGDLWRAARIDDRHLGPLVAVRRLSGGNREALAAAAADAREIVPLLSGTSFVKEQMIDVANGVPYVAHEYGGGRSLKHIVERAHGAAGITPNPIPIDQAVLIAEKVALSLATTADLRRGSVRLLHGALIPQFIWISDEGEIRVAGQQLGKGLIASLSDAKAAPSIGRYLSPEARMSGEPSQSSDVYAMGAVLFLLVTGNEPPDPTHVSAFQQAIRAGKTTAGDPMPDDIRAILDKSLTIDPSRRYGSVGDMKQALSALAHSGKYSATTFNLAFYLSTLMKKELEGEAIEREKESKVNIAPYLEQQIEMTAPPAPVPASKEPRSKAPLYAAAAAVAVAVAGAGFWVMKPAAEPAKPMPVRAARLKTAPATELKPVATSTVAPAAATASVDPAAEKKAFEAAVNQKLQEEMTKLQSQFNKQLPQKPARTEKAPSPVLTASIAPQKREPQVLDDRAPSAAALDERRLASARQETSTQPNLTPAPATQTVAAQPAPQQAAPAAAPVPAIKEGDLVNFDEVDVRPTVISRPQLQYPPMAMRQRVQATLILSVLVSENGDVDDVQVLRGDSRFGFNNEAMRLLRGTKFRPAMKDGKRVKTWLPQPVEFKLQ
jgi:TonB family protein